MASITVILGWFAHFELFDWLALAFFLTGLLGYRMFLSVMLKTRPDNLFLGKLQQYRKAWIENNSGDKNGIVVVQTLRNTIMSASFLASTAVILIMGAFNLLYTIGAAVRGNSLFGTGAADPSVEVFKVLLIIIILSYSFFNFTWYIREVNYMSFILNIPKDQLDRIEGGDSTSHIAGMFLTSGIYFSLGMRGYYFLVPLMLWFFSPLLMILSSLMIFFILIRRDLAA
jgi:uncharacterized membrane protein